MKRVVMLLAGAACAVLSARTTSGSRSIAGVWRVSGEGFDSTARLPGTLGGACLGKRWTENDFRTTMDFQQSQALVQEWQYVGRAEWARTVELAAEDCRHPLELFLERVM
jgi:hypothetical protein